MRPYLLAGVMILALLLASTVQARNASGPDFPKTQQTMEVLAFSEDGKLFAVKTLDEEGRRSFQVRSSRKGEIEDVVSFFEDDESKSWKRVKRKHKLKADPSDSGENEKLGITLVTAQKGKKLHIYVMKGEKVKRYGSVDLLATPDGKTAATSSVKQLIWCPKGKHVVMVYSQKMKKPHKWESDSVHAFKFKRYKANFDDAE